MPRSIPIILDRARNLRFDINALGDADHVLRASLVEVLQQALSGSGMRISDTRALLWAGLKHEDPHLSLHGAGRLMEEALDHGLNLAELQLKIGEAIGESRLFAGAGEKNAVPEAAVQSTSGSGSTQQDKTPTAH